jgi:hypothetical protein
MAHPARVVTAAWRGCIAAALALLPMTEAKGQPAATGPAAGQPAGPATASPQAASAPPASGPDELAPPPTADPSYVQGIEERGEQGDDAARTAAEVLLFVPRNFIDLLFEGTAAAAGLVRDEQIVPRYEEALATPHGQLFVFPTMFVETGAPLSFGARMIGKAGAVTTSYRMGYGIPSAYVFEGRVRYVGLGALPFEVTLEGLAARDLDREYLGLGQSPATDSRNHFLQPDGGQRSGLYSERKVRLIGSVGVRASRAFELFLSSSLTRRTIHDMPDAGNQALSQVFAPASVGAAFDEQWVGYSECAARLDSRPTRGRPSPGVLAEGYVGAAVAPATSSSLDDRDVTFMRMGGRVAGFIPIYRRTNILSPRLALDRLVSLGGPPAPFTELPRQPDFRGFDTRRDGLSLVASLDYSWQLVDFLGVRVFLDAATTAPSVAELSVEQLKELRLAAGTGLDLFVSSDDVGQLAFSASPEGVRLLLSLGVPSDYGDRQHRE